MHDTTLSPPDTVDAIDSPEQSPREWFLAIIFHPDTARIGETCCVPATREALELGRFRPFFSHPGGEVRSIDDSYVSRAACRLQARGDGWCLRLGAGRSRLRVDGSDTRDRLRLTGERLQRGITLALGPRVLLHLRLQGAGAAASRAEVPGLLGVSAAMQALRRAVHRAAQTTADLLLTGPTGTGKERVARAVHKLSERAGGPWVAVNMAALPVEIAAASLFGARRGAYTGADRHRSGLFQQAAGGTLFLDEVGDTPEALQPLLLRALQEREVQVVGGPVERVDLRVVSATERVLDAPGSGFRPALRFRLGALEIALPPLAEHREDVGVLAAHFFRRAAEAEGRRWLAETANDRELARWARCLEQLTLYTWPGNVRELEHLAMQIHGASTERMHLPSGVARRIAATTRDVDTAPADTATGVTAPSTDGVRDRREQPWSLAEVDDETFLQVWRKCRFEVAAAARQLQVSRAAVYRRLRHMDQCRLAADVPLEELFTVLESCRGDLRACAERLSVSRRGLETRLRATGVADRGAVARVSDASG